MMTATEEKIGRSTSRGPGQEYNRYEVILLVMMENIYREMADKECDIHERQRRVGYRRINQR